jgi:hypothetical protein
MDLGAAFVLSPLALVAWTVLTLLHFRRPRQAFAGAVRIAATVALAGYPLWCLALVWRLIADPSSTAVAGIYGVPALAAFPAGLTFAAGWALAVLARAALPGPGRPGPVRLTLAALVLAGLAWLLVPLVRQELLLRTARSPATPPSRLAELYRREAVQEDPLLVAAIAANPRTPAEVLAAIAAADRPEWRRPRVGLLRALLLPAPPEIAGVDAALAGNPSSPPELLATPPGTGETGTAFNLARNPATPAELLASLAESPEPSVRSAVAANPRAPAEVLARLAADESRPVRRAVAANAATPPAALSELARTDDRDTRALVAANPNTPRSVLEPLARDADETVRAYAARALQDPSRR